MLYRGNLELLESWCNKINLLTYLPARHNSTTIPQRYICTSNKIRSWLKVSSILISPVSEIAGTKWIHKKTCLLVILQCILLQTKEENAKITLKRAGKSNKTIESRIDLLVKQDAVE